MRGGGGAREGIAKTAYGKAWHANTGAILFLAGLIFHCELCAFEPRHADDICRDSDCLLTLVARSPPLFHILACSGLMCRRLTELLGRDMQASHAANMCRGAATYPAPLARELCRSITQVFH